MTTKDFENDDASQNSLGQLEANLEKLEELTQRLVKVMGHKREVPSALQGPGQELYMKAATAYMAEMMHNPTKIFEHQIGYWGKTLQHYMEAQQNMLQAGMGEEVAPPAKSKDRRFSDPMWDTHPYFHFLKQQYMLNAEAVDTAVADIEGLDEKEKKRLEYFSRQIVDLMSPTNFLGTNPEALQRAVETEGQSLVDGLENLVRDLEANDGDLVVTLADKDAFQVGENIGTTKGKVVFRNRLFELIQYSPTTDQVHEPPLLIFPPWINKFYIMDLKPENSLVKWVVDQGYTLFVVSWVNPDETYADVALDTYIEEGYLEAIDVVKQICGVKKINAVGYCIAGTTLSLTLALMKKRKDNSVKSATLFTTMTDFADQGEFVAFLQDDFVDGIEEEALKTGYLDKFYMARTFSFLRSNDLIYKPAIRSYMMGQTPPAFDLLYWNGDGTNLPAKMAVQYLRDLCQKNRFADGGILVCGETLRLKDVSLPVFAIACETDHIAQWHASYQGVQQMGSKDKTFVLSESGHIAGIINPPSKNKYGHYTNPELGLTYGDWRESAEKNDGSWWPRWEAWLSKQSGKKIPAREPGTDAYPALCDAPGTYVIGQPDARDGAGK